MSRAAETKKRTRGGTLCYHWRGKRSKGLLSTNNGKDLLRGSDQLWQLQLDHSCDLSVTVVYGST